jgi:Icc protein
MIVCQISDLHVQRDGLVAHGVVDTSAKLAECLDHIVRLPQPPDAIVATGDLTDTGDPLAYARLRSMLERLHRQLPVPVYLMPGNHDERGALRAAFPEHSWLDQCADFIQYAVDIGPLRLVTIDTVVPGRDHGEVCARRLAWLDATLAAAPQQPTIVAMHHPPFASGIGYMDDIALRDPQPLEELIRRHRQVQRVICGHLHRSLHLQWAGVALSCCPSPAHQLVLDLGPSARAAFVMEPPAVLLHMWNPTLGLVTHQSVIGHYEHHSFGELQPQ